MPVTGLAFRWSGPGTPTSTNMPLAGLPSGGFRPLRSAASVVPDPLRVAGEMIRVCRRKGRLVFLNHFHDRSIAVRALDRAVGHVARAVTGVSWDLELDTFLERSGLTAMSVERVNVPRVSSVVVCRRP